MTKYREILRLDSMGFSQRNIAASCSVSRNTKNTVASVLQRSKEAAVSWQQAALREDFWPDKAQHPPWHRRTLRFRIRFLSRFFALCCRNIELAPKFAFGFMRQFISFTVKNIGAKYI